MGFLARLSGIIEAKLNKRLDTLEDPNEMLDYSIVQMEKYLKELTSNAIEIVTAKKKLEIQLETALTNAKSYKESAQKALELGQEDLARQALTKKEEAEVRVQRLSEQINTLNSKMTTLNENQEELRRKIQLFGTKKEELKAVYNASQAQLKVKEIITSLSKDSSNIADTIERAEGKVRDAEARVQAIDYLVNQGEIQEIFSKKQDDIDQRLKRLTNDMAVENELNKLKEKIGKDKEVK